MRILRVLRGLTKRIPRNRKVRAGLIMVVIFVFIAAFGPFIVTDIFHMSPNFNAGPNLAPPSAAHPLGTTAQGEDVMAQLVIGIRTSLLVGLVSGVIATTIAVVIGLSSAYLGGKLDMILSMFTNIFLVIPGLPLTIIIASYVHGKGGWIMVALIIGLTGWAGGARIKRAQALSIRNRDFMTAAKMTGASTVRIVFTEMMPHLASLISSTFLFSVVAGIVAESSLSFIGAGNVTEVTLGSMLYWAQNQGALVSGAWWWFVPPGLCIALIGMAAGLINFGMDEVTNPRQRAVARARELKQLRRREAKIAARAARRAPATEPVKEGMAA